MLTEPAATDPLCQAVARAVAAGITVVVSAGNYGLTPAGQPVLGAITSPGNSPYAITVGAIDTKGTADPSDDEVAPYSSKGPTAFDGAVKPDVVAPGTRITSLVSQNSYIIGTYPQWYMGGSGKNEYMRLTGTSMAAAVVSGGTGWMGGPASAEPAHVNGWPALVIRLNGQIDGVVAVRIDNGLVTGLYYVRNPHKLEHLHRETALDR